MYPKYPMYLKTSRVIKKTSPTKSTLVNDNIFDLSQDECIDYLLYKNNTYTLGDKNTVSIVTFYKRMVEMLNPLFGDDFDWSNLCVTGGIVAGMMENVFNEEVYGKSDIDIFVYGLTSDKLRQKIDYVQKYMERKFKDSVYIFTYDNVCVLTILPVGHRQIQIIGFTGFALYKNTFQTPMDILNSFDLTHCQIGMDVSKMEVVWTKGFAKAIKTKVCAINEENESNSIQLHRLLKAYRKGYSISKPKKQFYVVNSVHTEDPKQNKYEFTNTDGDNDNNVEQKGNGLIKLEAIQNQLNELINDPIIVQKSNKCYFPKIDESPAVAICNIKDVFGVNDVIMLSWPHKDDTLIPTGPRWSQY